MEWIADVSVGDWLRERLDDNWGDIHHFVPHGFEAYARIFHRPSVAVADDSEGTSSTWAEAASAFGTTLHAQASWQRIVRTPVDEDWRERRADDGRSFSAPAEGELDVDTLRFVAAHLMAHTTTPDHGCAAVWEGWAGLVGFQGTAPTWSSLTSSEDPNHELMLQQSIHNRFDNPFQRTSWQQGVLSDEISRGPRLSLPDRDHVLFSATPRTFTDPVWPDGAPWKEAPLSLLWPDDHAWVLVSEIDDDSTVVAGSADLIRAICADARVEALPIREGTDLSWDTDDINR